jgi:hypothetical protein
MEGWRKERKNGRGKVTREGERKEESKNRRKNGRRKKRKSTKTEIFL